MSRYNSSTFGKKSAVSASSASGIFSLNNVADEEREGTWPALIIPVESVDITTPNTSPFNSAGTNSFDLTFSTNTLTSGAGFSSTLDTGKKYLELKMGNTATSNALIGLVDAAVTTAGYMTTGVVCLYAATGNKIPDNVNTSLEPFDATNDIVMFAYDTSTREFWVGVNGSWYQNPNTTSSSFTVGSSSTTAFKLLFANGAVNGASYNGTIINGSGTLNYNVPTGFTAH